VYLIIDKRRKAKGKKGKNYHQDIRCHRERKKARLIFVSGITQVRPHGCRQESEKKREERRERKREREREREREDTFRRILFRRARQKQRWEKKEQQQAPLPTAAATTAWYRIENFYAKARLIFKLLPVFVGVRTRWQGVEKAAGGGHILIKRLLSWKLEYYCESRRPKFRGTTVAAPPTDATLQACLAPGLRLSEIGAIWRRATFTNRILRILFEIFSLKMAI